MKKNFTRTLYRLQARLSHRVNWRWLNNWKTLTGISLLTAGGMSCKDKAPERTPARFVFPDGVAVDLLALNDSAVRQNDIVYAKVEEEPIFPHGNVMAYIRLNNEFYPGDAMDAGLTGKVLVGCTIDERGKVTNARVAHGLHPVLDSNALKIVTLLPDFLPVREKGKPVIVECTIPVAYTREMIERNLHLQESFCYVTIDLPAPWESLEAYILRNVRYPKEALEKGIKGNVYVGVTIRADGSVTDEHIVRGAHPLLDNEALRIAQKLPQRKPARINGKPVDETYVITVPFDPKYLTAEPWEDVYIVVEDMPKFLEGDIIKYVNEHLRYPKEAKEQGIEGKVFVQFIIERSGYIVEVKVLRPVHPLLDEEAMRVVLHP